MVHDTVRIENKVGNQVLFSVTEEQGDFFKYLFIAENRIMDLSTTRLPLLSASR